MQCRIRDFRCKEVINVCDGCRLGYVSDLDVRVPEGQVVAIIVYGPGRFFGLFGRGEEFYIPWECIQRIGDDIILIDKPFQRRDPRLTNAPAAFTAGAFAYAGGAVTAPPDRGSSASCRRARHRRCGRWTDTAPR